MERREFMKQAGLGALGVMLTGKATGEEAKIRWGLVGMGKRCLQHIKVLNKMPEYEIVALCDIQNDRLNIAAGLCQGAEGYEDYHKLLSAPTLT